MTKVKFKKADKPTIRRIINHGGKLVEDTITKHKKLIETTFKTEVEFIDYQKMETEWIVFRNETHVYKSWTNDSAIGEFETNELNCFFEYHNSKLLEDWKLIPPFGCIQKQRRVPGKPLRLLEKEEYRKIDLEKFSNWWVEEQLHIHDVGIQLSKHYPEFGIPFTERSFRNEGYIFCFADLTTDNIMIDPETNTYNFIDFQPIGWILQDHYNCLHDSHLFVAFDRMSDAIGPIEKYCDYVSNQLRDRMIAVGL